MCRKLWKIMQELNIQTGTRETKTTNTTKSMNDLNGVASGGSQAQRRTGGHWKRREGERENGNENNGEWNCWQWAIIRVSFIRSSINHNGIEAEGGRWSAPVNYSRVITFLVEEIRVLIQLILLQPWFDIDASTVCHIEIIPQTNHQFCQRCRECATQNNDHGNFEATQNHARVESMPK